MEPKEKALLIVLDGWGLRQRKRYNAIAMAHTPNFDRLWKENPHCTLHASQRFVGLPRGYMGNSEVGHTHLGAGRMLPQELMKINESIRDGSFFNNKVLLNAIKHSQHNGSALHLLGMLSDGGVHSHIDHLFAILKMCKKLGAENVHVHAILDGRDTSPKCAKKYLARLDRELRKLKMGKICTIMGRFYAMDRDNRWNREHKAYDAMVNHVGRIYGTWQEALSDAYAKGENDEFVKPSIIEGCVKEGNVSSGDSIIFFNFREDRAREITRAFVQGKFQKFKRKKLLDLYFACLTQYDKEIKAPVAFAPEVPNLMMGELLARYGIKQFRLAETEKYAHVTYFFNGGREGPWKGEERGIISSPRVRTYDLKPEMSALKVTAEAVRRLKTGKHGFILMNYANADMVGHTGMLKPTIRAVETVDEQLGRVVSMAREKGYNVVVTADHGNAEEMIGKHRTSHTLNKVPMILLANEKYKIRANLSSSIAQITPTVMKVMGLDHEAKHFRPLLR